VRDPALGSANDDGMTGRHGDARYKLVVWLLGASGNAHNLRAANELMQTGDPRHRIARWEMSVEPGSTLES
jgi:hypothetical protein